MGMDFGKIEYICEEQNPRNGVVPVVLRLTLIGQSDEDLLLKEGVRGLRLHRIKRITDEAELQGCLLRYEDLSSLLVTSLATLKRDVAYLEAQGRIIPLKGRRKNGNGNGSQKESVNAAHESTGTGIK